MQKMKIVVAYLLTLLLVFSLAACGAKPAEKDQIVDEPQKEQEVVVDAGEEKMPVVDAVEEEETAEPEQDESPVENTTEPVEEEEVAPVPEEDPSGNEPVPNPDGSIGTTIVNGEVLRQFPAGYDVNTITPNPDKFFERVMIGNDEYLWDGISWGIVDNTDPPNQSTIVQGQIGQEMSPFN